MRRSAVGALRTGLALGLLAACGGDAAGGPPAIAYGLDECARCRMIVSEAAFAAARVSPDGQVDRFDDIGCLLAALATMPRDETATAGRIWVHDRETGKPMAAAAGWFVRLEGRATPMGSGWVAFADRERAQEYAAHGRTEVERWTDLSSSDAIDNGNGR